MGGKHSLADRYSKVKDADVPFAENCLGDPFLLREGKVVQLIAEAGEVELVDTTLVGFLRRCARRDPEIWLGARYLRQFVADGEQLDPDRALVAYPPLTLAESTQGVSLKAIPRLAAIDYLSEFARRIKDLPDGTKVKITTGKPKT